MRIVLLQPNLLGDVIVTTPLLRQLRTGLPEARLTLVLGPRNRDVRPLLGDLIDDVLDYEKRPGALLKLAWRARRPRFDWLIDLTEVHLKASRLLTRLIGARRSIGFANGHAGLYDHTLPLLPKDSVHIADRYLKPLGPLGITPSTDARIELVLPASAKELARRHWPAAAGGPVVLVNISGTGAIKRWGGERYIRWMQSVRAAHPELRFAVTGHARDQEEMKQVAIHGEGTLLPLTPNFTNFAAYVRAADYVFTPETSVLHLAAAWQRPCLGLYVQRDGDNWTPYRSPNVCLLSPTVSVTDIAVEQAIEGFGRLLELAANPPRTTAHV